MGLCILCSGVQEVKVSWQMCLRRGMDCGTGYDMGNGVGYGMGHGMGMVWPIVCEIREESSVDDAGQERGKTSRMGMWRGLDRGWGAWVGSGFLLSTVLSLRSTPLGFAATRITEYLGMYVLYRSDACTLVPDPDAWTLVDVLLPRYSYEYLCTQPP